MSTSDRPRRYHPKADLTADAAHPAYAGAPTPRFGHDGTAMLPWLEG